MVTAQTALAIFLLVGAGLFMRTLTNLRSADLGFRTDGLLYARIEPRSGGLVQARYLNITDEELRKAMTGVWERRRQLRLSARSSNESGSTESRAVNQ